MRVGIIAADLSHRHGWAHYSLELVRALVEAGVEVRVVASRNSPHVEGVELHPILPTLVPRERFLLLRLLATYPKTRTLLKDCDLIHCCVEPFAPLAALVAGKRPFFQGGVGSYLRINGWQRPPLTALYRRAIGRSHIICISHYTAKIAREAFPAARVDAVPLGINPDRFTNLPAVPKHGNTILTVGGVKHRKGTLPLVKAIAVVRQQFPDVQCIVLGSTAEDTDYTREVRKTIHALNLQDTVHLRGFVPEAELLEWYAKADIFVLPSMNKGWMFEGYGLVHMEASAARLPVIGTFDCGVEDAVDHGVTGLLVPQPNIDEELPQAILTLLRDPQRRAEMGSAGRKKAQRQTWARVAEQIIAIYRQALNHAHPGLK
jgi:glycosyltransferase involved in cell wall biosynthesis